MKMSIAATAHGPSFCASPQMSQIVTELQNPRLQRLALASG